MKREARGPARRISVAAAIASAAVIGAVVAFAIMSGPRAIGTETSPAPLRSTAPIGTTTTEPTPSSTPTPEPAATPVPDGPASMAWVEGGIPPDGRVNAVTWIGDRWLAVGTREPETAATWTSVDGSTWEAGVTVPTESTSAENVTASAMSLVAVHDGMVLAFGRARVGCCDRPMVWRSTDGMNWSVVPVDDALFDPGPHPVPAFDVAISPRGELVVLSQESDDIRTVVLVTSDFTVWEQTVLSEDEFTWMHHLAASPKGLLGIGTTLAGNSQPRAWWSADGRTWTPVTPPSEGGSLHAITYDTIRDQFIVGGVDANDRPTIWLTGDGSGWTTVTLDEVPGLVQSVSAAGGLVVAFGKVGEIPIPVESNPQLVAWSSHDGLTWMAAELGGHSGLPLIAVTGAGGVGIVTGSGHEPNRSWHGTPN